jgi:hypothetical protein
MAEAAGVRFNRLETEHCFINERQEVAGSRRVAKKRKGRLGTSSTFSIILLLDVIHPLVSYPVDFSLISTVNASAHCHGSST